MLTTFTPTTYLFQVDILWDLWTDEDEDELYYNDEWDEDYEDEDDYDEDLWSIENREMNRIIAEGLGLR